MSLNFDSSSPVTDKQAQVPQGDLDGFATPEIQEPNFISTIRRGAIALVHTLENSMNPNNIRHTEWYQERHRREKEASRLRDY